ncbi:hypothetical protein [Planotetraspora kaengkrachanensis]|uniref:CARDB domain-containing protein n=1 Tax=Planotetraspora kaengkrachanensis TaxID=575193 RepID=A0A8J3PV10_9ACTN|nr:hypothetical protein [Planotetraspora kaengkrachanensis]GIG81564.1 hypothetical protein Pka01_46910 [Planotetraspora kaengkrachanensis]
MKLRAAALIACSVLLTACTEEAGTAEQATGSPPTATGADDSGGAILETGFGQEGTRVRAIAIVHNSSDAAGQKVTVRFDVKDATGKTLASGSRMEQFAHAGEKMPVSAEVALPVHKKAASVDAALLVEDGTASSEPFPEVTVDAVETVKLGGGWAASMWVTNPKPEPLRQPRVETVCYDEARKIIGGGHTSPVYLPPSGDTIVEACCFITSGKPASCTGYVGVNTFNPVP